MKRPLRLGHQLSGRVKASPVNAARHAEELGFDIVLVADHVGTGMAPLPTLAAIAAATTTIRLGTMVLNNDMRNPVQLAQREPNSKVYWLAEAENWSRLSREPIHLERMGSKDDPFEQFLAVMTKQPRP